MSNNVTLAENKGKLITEPERLPNEGYREFVERAARQYGMTALEIEGVLANFDVEVSCGATEHEASEVTLFLFELV